MWPHKQTTQPSPPPRRTLKAKPFPSQPSRSWIWEQDSHPYGGKIAALATKHDKLPLIGPALEQTLSLNVESIAVDTDTFGTFTGDVVRLGTPLETATAKARLGMKASGHLLGIASEGSIGPDSAVPLVTADRELIVFIDDEADIVVWESYTSWDIKTAKIVLRAGDEIDQFLPNAGFPTHKLIVRPNDGSPRPIYKGIDRLEDLMAAIEECTSADSSGLACVETDLRAHVCPTRQTTIVKAAKRLASRLATPCPSCFAPGWGVVDYIYGIPCASCGTEIAQPRAEVYGCPACSHNSIQPLIAPDAKCDPGECPRCNP